jgi:hypothetical protein
MRRVNGYLSRKAQGTWPGSLVYTTEAGADESEGPETERKREWILERPGLELLGLGESFQRAQDALTALLTAERQKKQLMSAPVRHGA